MSRESRSASSTPAARAAVAVVALPRWQRYTLYATLTLLIASGIGWLFFAWPDAPTAPAARTAALWLLRVHGIAAYAVLVIAGSVMPVHVRLGWNLRRNRWSGSVLAVLLIGLACSGLWLYYGPEAGRELVSTLHWVVGLALPPWVWLHRAWGRRRR